MDRIPEMPRPPPQNVIIYPPRGIIIINVLAEEKKEGLIYLSTTNSGHNESQEWVSASEIASYNLELVGTGDAYPIAVKGSFELEGTEHPMKLDHLSFGDSGKIRADGNDEVGNFEIRGRLSKDGKVFIRKQYIGSHNILYKGTLERGVITGQYNTQGNKTGPFKIEFIGLIGGDCCLSWIGINSDKVIGLLYDGDINCWSVLKLAPIVGDSVAVKLLFVDGRLSLIHI